MLRHTRLQVGWLLLMFAAGAPICFAQGEAGTTEPVTLSIYEGRPLAAVLLKLQDKYGVPLSYEDVKWENPQELMPLGGVPGQGPIRDPDRLSPALASLQVDFAQDAKTKNPVTPLEKVLRDAVNSHAGRGNPGEFRLISFSNGSGFVVVPSRGKDRAGNVRDIQSPFDARISFPAEPRGHDALLAVILKAASAAVGEPVLPFLNGNDQPLTITIGANNEVARDVLAKALRAVYPQKASWHLYYDPAEHFWALNIVPVYKEFINSSGATRINPVYWPADTQQ